MNDLAMQAFSAAGTHYAQNIQDAYGACDKLRAWCNCLPTALMPQNIALPSHLKLQ